MLRNKAHLYSKCQTIDNKRVTLKNVREVLLCFCLLKLHKLELNLFSFVPVLSCKQASEWIEELLPCEVVRFEVVPAWLRLYVLFRDLFSRFYWITGELNEVDKLVLFQFLQICFVWKFDKKLAVELCPPNVLHCDVGQVGEF